jgi:hypothetical protein
MRHYLFIVVLHGSSDYRGFTVQLHRKIKTQSISRQTFMLRLEHEPTIPMFERGKTFRATDRSATVIGWIKSLSWGTNSRAASQTYSS